MPSEGGFRGVDVAVPLRKPPKYEVMLPQIVEMAEAGSGVDLISRALDIGAEVVRDALHLHRTGKRPPGRVDGRRREPRQSGKPFVPKYQQIALEVDRRRKAGEGFDRLARELKVSRPTVVRAYDFANRDEAASAAREGRTPTRPPYNWSKDPGPQNKNRGERDCSWSLWRAQRRASQASLGCDQLRTLAPRVASFKGGSSHGRQPLTAHGYHEASSPRLRP
jgi:hypothetical protein